MRGRGIVFSFLLTATLSFAVTLLVTLLWNLIAHGQASFDWSQSFRMGIIFGVVLTWLPRGKRQDG
ncbi:MAG: hypothetical protein GF330_03585 [Candidatus Eisenbacteria bacterium]|nr:hypothetical protein [Candidatus Eisenbacteria bacterium]